MTPGNMDVWMSGEMASKNLSRSCLVSSSRLVRAPPPGAIVLRCRPLRCVALRSSAEEGMGLLPKRSPTFGAALTDRGGMPRHVVTGREAASVWISLRTPSYCPLGLMFMKDMAGRSRPSGDPRDTLQTGSDVSHGGPAHGVEKGVLAALVENRRLSVVLSVLCV